MTERKLVNVTLSGDDLKMFKGTIKSLEKMNVNVADAEVLRIALRSYFKSVARKNLDETDLGGIKLD